MIPLDWNEKKAELYRLGYQSSPLYEPLEAPSPGLVMPRTVSDSADMAESFAAAGIDEGVAKGLELYLQLAMDVQAQSKDWRRDAQQQPFPFMDKYFEPEESSEPDDEDDVEELKAKLKQLKDANADFREALYHAQREIEAVKEDATKVEAQAASERTELAELRELVFTQANAEQLDEPETERAAADQFPYNTKKRIVFYKIINVVRTNQVPIRYFGYASAMKCAMQVLDDDA